MNKFFLFFSPELTTLTVCLIFLCLSLFTKITSFCKSENLSSLLFGFLLVCLSICLCYLISICNTDTLYMFSYLTFHKGLFEFKLVIILLNIFYFISFSDKIINIHRLEIFYFLIVIFLFSVFVLISSNNLFLIFLCLELQNFVTYFLIGLHKHQKKTTQSVFTYFLLNSILSFVFLFCLVFFYLMYSTITISELQLIINSIFTNSESSLLFWINLSIIFLMFSVLIVKLALVPFQFWIKEVYSGVSFFVMGFLNINLKLVLFYLLLHFLMCFNNTAYLFYFKTFLLIIGSITLLIGCIVTLYQTTIKMFLICSSITHTGYILILMSQYSDYNYISSVFCYILFYVITLSILWSILSFFSEQREQFDFSLSELPIIFKYYPVLSVIFCICILSLSGLPPFIGFFFKYLIFSTVSESGISGIALLYFLFISAVTCFYYLYILKVIFFDPLPVKRFKLSNLLLTDIKLDIFVVVCCFILFTPFIYEQLYSILFSFSSLLFF